MNRAVVGLALSSVLLVATGCTSSTNGDEGPSEPSASTGVPQSVIEGHEAGPGSPTGFDIEIPDGAVQVGPLIRQRRLELPVGAAHDDPPGSNGSGDDPSDLGNVDELEDLEPGMEDPTEPVEPEFTTALLRIDGDPDETIANMFEEIADALPDAGIDPARWPEFCTVDDGIYTGCLFEASGLTDDEVGLNVTLTVDAGLVKKSIAPPGSLRRPVMTLTFELDDSAGGPDGPDAPGPTPSKDAKPDRPKDRSTPKGQDRPKSDGRGRSDDRRGSQDQEPKPSQPARWLVLDREAPAAPGDPILTNRWKVHRATTVVLSGFDPSFALLAVDSGADTEAIARRYVSRFADPGTTPKIDIVEDRNEISTTYTPRNAGNGPDVTVTTVATGRGNYIELIYSDDTDPARPHADPTENDTRSSTGNR